LRPGTVGVGGPSPEGPRKQGTRRPVRTTGRPGREALSAPRLGPPQGQDDSSYFRDAHPPRAGVACFPGMPRACPVEGHVCCYRGRRGRELFFFSPRLVAANRTNHGASPWDSQGCHGLAPWRVTFAATGEGAAEDLVLVLPSCSRKPNQPGASPWDSQCCGLDWGIPRKICHNPGEPRRSSSVAVGGRAAYPGSGSRYR
jgi:hypothetical protein